MKPKALVFSVFFSVLAISGCTLQQVQTFNKYATLRFWDAYKTDVQYWPFKHGVRVDVNRPEMFPAHIADDKSYVQFLIDDGSMYIGLPAIYTADIKKSIEIYKPYFQWANLPFDEREKQKAALNNSASFKEYRFAVQNELGTQEPLFIITRGSSLLFPDKDMAMTKKDLVNMIILASYVKKAKDERRNL